MNRNTHHVNSVHRRFIRPFGFSLSAALAVAFSTASHAGVIALGSTLDVSATSGRDSFEVIDSASALQGGTINTLGALGVSAVSTSAGGTSITNSSGIATWNDTASGQVRFENVGWDNSDFSSGVVSNSSLAGTEWTYSFLADVSGQFTLDWAISLHQSVADSFGLQSFRVSVQGYGVTGSLVPLIAHTEDASGTYSSNIFAGHEYTALIQTNAGLFGGIGGRTAFMDGVFDWSMDSGPMADVPEPSSMALLGLGLLGLRATRKRLSAQSQAIVGRNYPMPA